MVYKMTEFQGSSGLWYCNDVSNLAGGSGNWWNAARAWNLTPAAFIEKLIKDYKPDKISYSMDKNVLTFGWKSQVSMRLFKNHTNAQARKNNFNI
jgi:hypothetical protein